MLTSTGNVNIYAVPHPSSMHLDAPIIRLKPKIRLTGAKEFLSFDWSSALPSLMITSAIDGSWTLWKIPQDVGSANPLSVMEPQIIYENRFSPSVYKLLWDVALSSDIYNGTLFATAGDLPRSYLTLKGE